MKTKLLITLLFITNTIIAQNIGFESLTVPASGYFNGSTEYSGSGNEEVITYEEDIANFHVNYTDTGAYDYWSGFAYTNQTDLNTASYTNYSAYSSNGGANNSNNYVIAYLYEADEITFDDENLKILWKDKTESVYNLLHLRKVCPCATCRGGDFGELGTMTGDIKKASIKLTPLSATKKSKKCNNSV